MSRCDAAMRQALDVLKDSKRWCPLYYGSREVGSAIHALEAALAEPQPQPEPVGAVLVNRESREGVMFYSVDMIPDPAALKDRFELVKVYTAQPQRQPLSDEQIEAAAKSAPAAVYELMHGHEITVRQFRAALAEFARAIEKAIGGDK